MFTQGGVYISISIPIYITQTPHKLNMENSITQVLLNGSMPNFAEVLYTVRTLFTQTLVEFGPIGQFLLGSLFSKWDLKVGISVSWQGFFIFMLRIRVGGLPCGLARPLIYIPPDILWTDCLQWLSRKKYMFYTNQNNYKFYILYAWHMYLCRNVSKAHYMRGGADVILLLYLTKNRLKYSA